MTSRNYQVRRRSLVSPKADGGISALLPTKRKALSRRYNSERREIESAAKPRFSDATLLWRTASGVSTFRLSASRQRTLLGMTCLGLFVLASFSGWLLWQRGEIAIERRRMEDSAALLREAHNAWVQGGGIPFRAGDSGVLGRSRSQALLAILDPEMSQKERREKDLRLLRDREELKKALRRTERFLSRARDRNSDLSLEQISLRKKNERLLRDMSALDQSLSLRRTALRNAEKRRSGAEDRLASVESSALSLLKDLRGVLGSDKDRLRASTGDPMVAIRDLAKDVAKEVQGRRKRLASYLKSLDYAISGLERTVFSMGILPDFLAGLGYNLSPVVARNDASVSGEEVEALLSAGLGGPLDGEAAEASLAKSDTISAVDYNQTFANLDDKFHRFDALRKLVGCMPLSHPLGDAGRFISGYGRRTDPFTREPAMHYGIDFGAWHDTSVYAGGKGRVSFTGYKTDYGRVVEIDHGCGFKTRYAHLSGISVKVDEEVDIETVVGAVGSTGRSTGPHLHYEVRLQDHPFDPKPFVAGVRDVF